MVHIRPYSSKTCFVFMLFKIKLFLFAAYSVFLFLSSLRLMKFSYFTDKPNCSVMFGTIYKFFHSPQLEKKTPEKS
jgi:hypothetical protein